MDTHSVLETEQHHLQLTDGGAVEVQLQLELRQRAGDDFSVGHAHELGQADHQGGDVLRLQPGLLRALQVRGEEKKPVATNQCELSGLGFRHR